MTVAGYLPDGEPIQSIVLENEALRAEFISYGASLKSLFLANVEYSLVLGLPDAEAYIGHGMYFGATVGRFANRIANAEFDLDGNTFSLDNNCLNKHILHGGAEGCGTRNWSLVSYSNTQVQFRDIIPAGHMGFPGEMVVDITYVIGPGAVMSIEIEAVTDAPSICNFAHHSYFNLSGEKDIRGHELLVHADRYLAVDDDLIPTGDLVEVDGDSFDFRKQKAVGPVIRNRLLDHNFCTASSRGNFRQVAVLSEENSGLSLEVSSTEPGLQVYDGSSLGSYLDPSGKQLFEGYGGLALEPQGWPDSPNHKHFPSDVLIPGEKYIQRTRFELIQR